MEAEYKAVLTEVFGDVLKEYAFIFGEVCSGDETPVNKADYLHSTVAFSGYRSGVIGVSISAALAAELAANVLGTDTNSGDSADFALDALEELTDIICGHFLTSAFGEEPIFHLSPPSASKIDEAEWRSLIGKEEAIGFTVEGIPAVTYVLVAADMD